MRQLFSTISSLNAQRKLTLFPDCGHEFNEEAIQKVIFETVDFVKK